MEEFHVFVFFAILLSSITQVPVTMSSSILSDKADIKIQFSVYHHAKVINPEKYGFK